MSQERTKVPLKPHAKHRKHSGQANMWMKL